MKKMIKGILKKIYAFFPMTNREFERSLLEIHQHIDFTYRDLMIALENHPLCLSKCDVSLETEYPVAYESLDHLYPHGTIRDNTRYPRFIEKCESICGGGGA